MTPHSHSRRTRDLLAGDLVAHRSLPLPTDAPIDKPNTPAAPVEKARSVYSKASAARAWVKRREDLHQLANVGDVLADIDKQIADLQERVTPLLDGEAK